MVKVAKYNVLTKEFTQVPFPETYAWEWARANHIDEESMFIIVNHGFNKENEDAQAHLDEILNKGLYMGPAHYSLFMAGSGHLRKAQCVLIRDSIRNSFSYWLRCGVNDTINMVANKTLVYRAVSCLSASRKWEEMTNLPQPSIEKVAIFKDVEVNVEGIFDVVTSGNVTCEKRIVTNKISDGFNMLIVPDETTAEDMSSFTFRAPGFKGLLIPIKRSTLIDALNHLNLSHFVVDAFGVQRDLTKLDMISFCSTFKWSKCANWNEYIKNFKAMGHQFRICVKDHDAVADLPYQQFQTMMVDDNDFYTLCDRSVAYMAKYDKPLHASYLLPKFVGKTARLYPSLFANDYIAEAVQIAYASKRWAILGGRIPAAVKYRFAAPDPVAVLLGMQKKPLINTIPGKHVVCSCYYAKTVVDVTRCPHLDNAHLLRKVWMPTRMLAGLYTGKTMYFSAHDASMNAMQMDFDGDHVAVCNSREIVEMARKSIHKWNNVPLYYEAKGTKPGQVTREQIVTMLSGLEPAPVGLFANTLTKIYANGKMTDDVKRDIAFLTEGGNTCIDAAKYITGDSGSMENPGAARARENYGRKLKKPMFLAYAKSSPMVEGSFENMAAGCRFYETSAVDRYSERMSRFIPDELVIDGYENFDFRYKMLCDLDAEMKLLPGLIGIGGVFTEAAFHTTKEISEAKRASGEDRSAVVSQVAADMQHEVRKAVFTFGAQNGFSITETINALILGLFRLQKLDASKRTQMRVFWACFEEEVYNNVKKNIGENAEIPENDLVNIFGVQDEEEPSFFYDIADMPAEGEEGTFWM